MSTTRIVFFTSRMIAMMILLMLAVSFIVAVVALDPYLPKLLNFRQQSQPQPGTVVAGEAIAPVPTISFAVNAYFLKEVSSIDDPWAASAERIFNYQRFECDLPNKLSYGINSNTSHQWFYCVFRPNVASGSGNAMVADYNAGVGSYTVHITQVSWSNLDTARNYRYMLAWQRGTVTQTISHANLGQIRITAAVLPEWTNYDGGSSASCTVTHSYAMFNGATQIPSAQYSATVSITRVSTTDLRIVTTYTFAQTTTVTRIDHLMSCSNAYTNYLVHRIEFIDANGNPRAVTFQGGDTLVVEKTIRISS